MEPAYAESTWIQIGRFSFSTSRHTFVIELRSSNAQRPVVPKVATTKQGIKPQKENMMTIRYLSGGKTLDHNRGLLRS